MVRTRGSSTARGVVAVVVAAVCLSAAGCGARGQTPEYWAAPTDLAPSEAVVGVDGVVFSDIGEVAEIAGVVVRGVFAERVDETDGATLFGVESGGDELNQLTYQSEALRTFSVWSFTVDEVIKGDVATGPMLVLVEHTESDVPGRRVDPGRVGRNPVVLMVDAGTQVTVLGDAHFLTTTSQLGASFVVVGRDGRLVADPWGRIRLPAAAAENSARPGSGGRQLGLQEP